MGLQFELKRGTSLSKGYKIIQRFSEDIDIHIKPVPGFKVDDNPDNNSKTNVQARKNFYDQLANRSASTALFLLTGIRILMT